MRQTAECYICNMWLNKSTDVTESKSVSLAEYSSKINSSTSYSTKATQLPQFVRNFQRFDNVNSSDSMNS